MLWFYRFRQSRYHQNIKKQFTAEKLPQHRITTERIITAAIFWFYHFLRQSRYRHEKEEPFTAETLSLYRITAPSVSV